MKPDCFNAIWNEDNMFFTRMSICFTTQCLCPTGVDPDVSRCIFLKTSGGGKMLSTTVGFSDQSAVLLKFCCSANRSNWHAMYCGVVQGVHINISKIDPVQWTVVQVSHQFDARGAQLMDAGFINFLPGSFAFGSRNLSKF